VVDLIRRPRHRYTSTEEEDRGNTWLHYQQIPSLHEYVLISQASPRVEIFRRLPDGTWQYRDVTAGTVELTGGASLELASLYVDLPI
jgi:Uma2 family endonuclease